MCRIISERELLSMGYVRKAVYPAWDYLGRVDGECAVLDGGIIARYIDGKIEHWKKN